MSQFTLKKIAMYDYPHCGYEATKGMYFDSFYQFLNEGCSVLQSVNGTFYYSIDFMMEENGMDKFAAMLAGMLFMIEQNDVEADQAYGTYYDIMDFETGEYDYLFTEEDLKLIKNDIKIIKDYISKRPELLIEEEYTSDNESRDMVKTWKHRKKAK